MKNLKLTEHLGEVAKIVLIFLAVYGCVRILGWLFTL